MTSSSADWNRRFDFAREQAHTEYGKPGMTQAAIEAKRQQMIQSKALTPRIADEPEFAGFIVGLADLLKGA